MPKYETIEIDGAKLSRKQAQEAIAKLLPLAFSNLNEEGAKHMWKVGGHRIFRFQAQIALDVLKSLAEGKKVI